MDRQALSIAKLCVFEVPGLTDHALALTLPEVLAVGALAEIQPVPFCPVYVLGLSLWRDQLVTVIDLCAALTNSKADPHHLIIASRYLIGQAIWGDRRELFAWPIMRGTDTVSVTLSDVRLSKDSALRSELIYSVIHSNENDYLLVNAGGFAPK